MQTVDTQNRYTARALQLIRRAENDCGGIALTAPQVAQWLIDQREFYSRSTWRQYRAVLVFVFTEAIQADAQSREDFIEAIIRLQQSSPPQSRPQKRKTSAQKQKKLSDQDLLRLVKFFEEHPSRHGEATLMWLMAGIWTGLRPCEWQMASLTKDDELIVQNAKATNGRAHGQTRVILLSGLEHQALSMIRQHLVNVQQANLDLERTGKPGFERYYDCCRACLFEATRALWPRRKQFISLYSARHQFAADAKFNGLALEQIAALMGHRSTDTAAEHYGRRSAGNGGFKVKAQQEDVERVQRLNQPRAGKARKGIGM